MTYDVEVKETGTLKAVVRLDAEFATQAILRAAKKLKIPTDTEIFVVIGKSDDDTVIYDRILSTPPNFQFEARIVAETSV